MPQAFHRKINRKKAEPELRFSEFNDNWREKKFGDLFKFKSSNSLSRDKLNYENGEVKNIHYGDIHTRFRARFDVENERVPYINKDSGYSFNVDHLCKDGDLIVADASEDYADIGKAIEITNLANKKVVAGLHTFIARPEKDTFYTGFLSFLMQSSTVRKQIMILSQGTKVLSISPKYLGEVFFKMPSTDEQYKIVNLLQNADKYIEVLQLQSTKLSEYKRGVMQKIFSQELRFKNEDGENFSNWEVVSVGSFLRERKEYSIKGGDFPHISLTVQGVVPKSERYHRDFLVSDDTIKKYKITKLNDLCYNPANLKFNVISLNKLGDGIFSPIYITYEIKSQCVDFVGYYLTHSSFINKARRFEEGTVYERMAVNPKDFLTVKMAMPSVPEQEKISNFLSSIDALLFAKEQQIKNVKLWKKGLLQKMFV